jgi:plasmid stability protein
MRTTVNLPEDLLAALKKRAAESGRTLAAVLEDAVRDSLARRSQPRPRVRIPVSRCTGGTLPGVDLASNASLLAVMDEE